MFVLVLCIQDVSKLGFQSEIMRGTYLALYKYLIKQMYRILVIATISVSLNIQYASKVSSVISESMLCDKKNSNLTTAIIILMFLNKIIIEESRNSL